MRHRVREGQSIRKSGVTLPGDFCSEFRLEASIVAG